MKRRARLCFILLASFNVINGQSILGTVSNAFTHQPVPDAVISIRNTNLNVQSDQSGIFEITNLEPGRYILRIQHLQFNSVDIEVLIQGGRDARVSVNLEPRVVPLAEVTVPGVTTVEPERIYRITQDEIRRYPGTFFDPARFAASFPAVHVANDQANQLVIHGLHPDLMRWRMEGLEIVNPNHLSNAGTTGDRPTASGGGVHMLSNLMLHYSSLVTGPFDQRFGNAISGVMDMHLRSGNSDRPQHTAQIGLLGLDFATEGPFQAGKRSSYLVNARYSTVGLLNNLGVDFGDEAIRFYDIAMNLDLPIGNSGGRVKVFGFGGGNSNELTPKPVDEWEEDRDRQLIDYSSMTGALGIEWTQPVGTAGFFRMATGVSANEHDREELWQNQGGVMDQYATEAGEIAKWSSMLTYGHTTSGGMQFTGGLESVLTSRTVIGSSAFGQYRFGGDGNVLLVRPFVKGVFRIGNALTATLGGGLSIYDSRTDVGDLSAVQHSVLEPHLRLEYSPAATSQWSAGYRRSSQMLYDLALVSISADNANLSLKPLQADIFHIQYHHAFALSMIEVNTFLYLIDDIPAGTDHLTDVSALDLQRLPVNIPLTNNAEATNYGMSVAYRRNFSNGYFGSANIAVFSSKEEILDTRERPTTFDVGHSAYLAAGKEWTAERSYGKRSWGLNASVLEHGGYTTGSISQTLSLTEQRTIVTAGSQGSIKLDPYYRLDLRVYLRKDKAKHSSTWSLDIQNVLNRRNDFLPTYDFLLNQVRGVDQLGIVPVLNYRVDF